jgi:CubicO group peptidase (beta-lactamase class C family)
MHKQHMKSIFFSLLFLPVVGFTQSIAQKADELLTAYASQQKFSGNVLIAKQGKIIFEKAYGYADQKNKLLNTTQTEFRVGSLTKMFTSTLILQLAGASKLSLTDPVTKYVPGFANGEKIQLRHLLSHTSGIKGTTGTPAPTTLEESVSRFTCQGLSFEPGTRFEYNNFNYILLSYIAQKVTGVPFAKLVQANVLARAGMAHSGLDTKDRPSKNKALGYVTNPATLEWQVPDGGDVAIAAGAGALYSTTGDLYQWAQSLSTHAVLADTLLASALKPLQNNYGLGWMISEKNGRTQIGHTGSIPGYIANFMRFPKEDVTIILLANYQDTDGRRLSDDLVAVAFGEGYTLPVKKQVVALSEAVLNQYTGEYQLPGGFSITVSVEGNKLYALAQGDQDKIELTPESEQKFFLRGPETEIEFIREGDVIKYMFVNMQGGQKFTKVK